MNPWTITCRFFSLLLLGTEQPAAQAQQSPNIAVVGDFIGAARSNHVNPDPALQMHESEVAFQAIADPYARADFFFSYGEVRVILENGYRSLSVGSSIFLRSCCT